MPQSVNTLPLDYEERVYAGVLGKIIGVYLGRPFEQWSNKKIEEELGEINYYVHEKLNAPLIVTDDDISGTFTFLRALPDNGNSANLTAAQIGRTWLNYLIEQKTVLWWGGMGNSTEHTAYLRLKAGVDAPDSGSMELNGQVVSEQIGAQIFIDGWAMVAPGNPDLAHALAGKAASVSHDGEAIFGAQVIAVMESLAFREHDRHKLIDEAQTYVPRASVIWQLIEDLKAWYAADPIHWRATLAKLDDKYGYAKFGGGCHMVPNHGVILLALLYGEDDFQRTLMIANTSGMDTDCNSGNIGCLMGIKNGLAGLSTGPDFRGPVADRMFLPTADGGRCITDAVQETYRVVNIGRGLCGLKPVHPDNGVRFHFNLPGAMHGFMPDESVDSRGTVRLENVTMTRMVESIAVDGRVLAIRYNGVAPGRTARVGTATYIPPTHLNLGGYDMIGCPTLYSGQTVRAHLAANEKNERGTPVNLFVRVYGIKDALTKIVSETTLLHPGDTHTIEWQIPDTDGKPIAEIGLEVGGHAGHGTVYLDWLHWGGAPNTFLGRPKQDGGWLWRRAWTLSANQIEPAFGDDMCYRLIHNVGPGMATQGDSSWSDYTARVRASPHMAQSFGLVANGNGLRRWVGAILSKDGKARLIENSDGVETTLAEADVAWELDKLYDFSLTSRSDGTITAQIDEAKLEGYVTAQWSCGAVGMFVNEGNVRFGGMTIQPAEPLLVG